MRCLIFFRGRSCLCSFLSRLFYARDSFWQTNGTFEVALIAYRVPAAFVSPALEEGRYAARLRQKVFFFFFGQALRQVNTKTSAKRPLTPLLHNHDVCKAFRKLLRQKRHNVYKTSRLWAVSSTPRRLHSFSLANRVCNLRSLWRHTVTFDRISWSWLGFLHANYRREPIKFRSRSGLMVISKSTVWRRY